MEDRNLSWAVARTDRDGELPFTTRQEARLSRYGVALPPWSSAVQAGFVVRGSLDVGGLGAAVDAVVRRHEALRTTVSERDGRFVQAVADDPPTALSLEPLATEALDAILAEESRRPFDLSRGPLLRVTVRPLEDATHLVVFTLDHFVADGIALEIVLDEVSALLQGRDLGPPPELQFVDFAAWQRALLADEDASGELARWWRETLRGEVPQLVLPSDRRPDESSSHEGATATRDLHPSLLFAVDGLARATDATSFAVWAAAAARVLAEAAGRTTVTMLSPFSWRTLPGLARTIGDFSNSVPLRFELEGSESFRELALLARDVCLGALEHCVLPYDGIVGSVPGGRGTWTEELSQVFFAVNPTPRLELPGTAATLVPTKETASLFDLSLFVATEGYRARAEALYKRRRFDADRIDRLLEAFEGVLLRGTADPEAEL